MAKKIQLLFLAVVLTVTGVCAQTIESLRNAIEQIVRSKMQS